MDNWTIEIVEERLVEAAAVMRRLRTVRVPGYFNTGRPWSWSSQIARSAPRKPPDRVRRPLRATQPRDLHRVHTS